MFKGSYITKLYLSVVQQSKISKHFANFHLSLCKFDIILLNFEHNVKKLKISCIYFILLLRIKHHVNNSMLFIVLYHQFKFLFKFYKLASTCMCCCTQLCRAWQNSGSCSICKIVEMRKMVTCFFTAYTIYFFPSFIVVLRLDVNFIMF